MGPESGRGAVIWITGLSGSGKTTVATEVVHKLKAAGNCAILLDGDELRKILQDFRYDREARLELSYKYSRFARYLASQGLIVVTAVIAPFKEVHEYNRRHLPDYFEVFLKVDVKELVKRDVKGVYRKVNVYANDLAVEFPEKPDLVLEHTFHIPPEELARKVIEEFKRKRAGG